MKNKRKFTTTVPLSIALLLALIACAQASVQPSVPSIGSTALLSSLSQTTVSAETTGAPPVVTDPTTAVTTVPITITFPSETTQLPPPVTVPIEPQEPADADMVLLSEYLPEAFLDIRYGTTNNFTGQVIYEKAEPRLRYGTVKKLQKVCEKLEEKGFRLVIWDAWRPAEAQWKLWNICPDSTYVSDPNKGYSSHTRGGTVDISLVYLDGSPVEMPTDLDDFSKAADTDFSDVSPTASVNGNLLQTIMKECGFRPYWAEWWHFTDTHTWDVLESLSD